MLDQIDWEARGKEVVEEYRGNIARAINLLESSKDVFENIAEKNEWNDEITLLVLEAEAKLGTALASLTTWYDDDKNEE